MKPVNYLTRVLPLVLFLAACSKKSDPDPTPPPPATQTDIAALNTKVETFMSTYAIPGSSLAVSKNGKLVYIKAFGKADNSTSELVTTSHRFRLASVSKTFTGIAIMKLVQAGSITLDQKVFGTGAILGTQYGAVAYSNNVKNITVKQLLQHTAGGWGFNSGGDPIDLNPAYTNAQFLGWVLDNKAINNAPGTKYDYSNMGYFILGRIIEKISGKTYVNYIKEDIIAAVGGSKTDMAGKTLADRKTEEVKYHGQGNDASYVYTIAFPRRDADGGLMTTASELLRLINAVDGFPTRPDILNSTSITAFTTPSGAAPLDPNYACGIAVWNNVWYNYGSLPGTRTGFMRGNNGVSVALLLNSRADPSGNETPFVQAMQNLMLDVVNSSSYSWQSIDQF